MNAARRALAGAATAAVILLGTVGASAATAQTQPAVTTYPQALAAIDDGQRQVDAGQAKIQAGRDWLAANPPVTPAPPTNIPPTSTPPPVGDQQTAAARFGWGTPIASGSDEFNVNGAPDPAKWSAAGECWAGHAGNGRRCASRSTVVNGALVQTGLSNGDSAWLSSKLNQRYGRYEARVRSYSTGPSGNQYHPLLIIWPSSERWPQDGEYDFLENGAPGQPCAESFIHYPHAPGPVQQEFRREANCGAPLSEWHNIGFEWTPDYVRGFIDGVEWFKYSGGAGPGGRQTIQAMPSGSLKIQLDNFYGSGMRAARYEVDWVRTYPLR